MTEEKIIEGLIQKVTNAKTKANQPIHYIKIDGNDYSGFGEAEHSQGERIKLVYTENGKYKNIVSIELITSGNPCVKEEEIVEETVGYYVPDQRQKEITLGQAANMALKHLHENQLTALPEEFDIHFRVETKRFFRLLQELQRDLL
jgi:hypothetical protein